MACGIALRASTFNYHGAGTQRAFNSVASAHLGAYSDIASLYFRDRMWHHHLPYFHYPFEYPVGTGMLTWLTGLLGGGVGGYLAINAVVLVMCGLLTIWLLPRLPDSNPWLLALAPALALYVVLNWDLLSIAALIVAVVLFHRRHDAWSGAALGVATWTKFFPVIALPVMLLVRMLEGRGKRAAARILVPFALVTAAINLPVLIAHAGRWSFFFRFNANRPGAGSLWQLIYNGQQRLAAGRPRRDLHGDRMGSPVADGARSSAADARTACVHRVVLFHQQAVQPAIRPMGDGVDRRRGSAARAGGRVRGRRSRILRDDVHPVSDQ
jgi:hypothetical protein